MNTRDRDVSRVTLIKGTKIYEEVPVLSGRCPLCTVDAVVLVTILQQLLPTWSVLLPALAFLTVAVV